MRLTTTTQRALLFTTCAALLASAGCSKRKKEAEGAATKPAGGSAGSGSAAPVAATGTVKIDGSSTVFLISQAVAEEFGKTSQAKATVGSSGTGGGFKKFCAGELDIAGASRPITEAEVAACAKGGVTYVELPVAYDGLAIVVNPKNTFVDKLTTAELKTMWSAEAEGKVTTWAQVRAGWPDKPLRLFGPGTDSGTYEYFTEAINEKKNSSRADYQRSEDDNTLVQGVKMDENALGYFGFAYYIENKDSLKVVPVDNGKAEDGDGAIVPSAETVANGTYQPLSRPLFIYVSAKAMERSAVSALVDFYLDKAAELSAEVGYVALPATASALIKDRWTKRTLGSAFSGKDLVGVTIEQLLAAEGGAPAPTTPPAGSAAPAAGSGSDAAQPATK
jgi:phosphate transport system substrate-binding protein